MKKEKISFVAVLVQHPIIILNVEILSPFENYKYIIEPSAGTGSIYSLLPEGKRIGLDIEPKFPSIKLADFFQWIPPTDSTKENTLIVGNLLLERNLNLQDNFFKRVPS